MTPVINLRVFDDLCCSCTSRQRFCAENCLPTRPSTAYAGWLRTRAEMQHLVRSTTGHSPPHSTARRISEERFADRQRVFRAVIVSLVLSDVLYSCSPYWVTGLLSHPQKASQPWNSYRSWFVRMLAELKLED